MLERNIYIIACQQLDQLAKKLSIEWKTKNTKIIFGQLMSRDIDGKQCNQLLYLRRNIAKIARQLLINTKLEETKPRVTTKITWDKIRSMVSIFNTWRNKIEKTGWSLDVSKYDQIMENI